MKKYVVLLLGVLLPAVLCSASFAGDQPCPTCGGDGKVNCHECNGSGRCIYCGGDGKLSYVPSYGNGPGEYPRCNQCNGSGRCSNCNGNRTETCSRCSGSGTIWAPDGNDGGGNNDTTDQNGGNTGNQTLAPSITGSFGGASVGESYLTTQHLYGNIFSYAGVENGTPPFKWSVSKGTLPPGLGLFPGDHSESSVIDEHTDRYLHFRGILTTAGTYSFTLKATDANGNSAEKDFSIEVGGNSFDDGISIVTFGDDVIDSAGTNWYDGKFAYMEKCFAGIIPSPRKPYTWSLVKGTLPQGLELSCSDEVISVYDSWKHPSGNQGEYAYVSGHPEGNGIFTFMVKVTDADGRSARLQRRVKLEGVSEDDPTANGEQEFTDDPDPEISGTFTDGQEGEAYSGHVSASGGTAPYTWSVSQIDGLDEEMQLSASGLSLAASDSEVYASAGTTGQYAFLTGTPKYSSWGGGYYTFVLKVADANGNTNAKTFTVHIAGTEAETPAEAPADPILTESITITKTSLADGTEGASYNELLTANTSSVTWSVSEGELPDGLTLNSSTGVISGIPAKSGTYTFTVQASNGTSTGTKQYTLTIKSSSTSLVQVGKNAVITTDSLSDGAVGEEYSASIRVSADLALFATWEWEISEGSLPPGLTLGSYTGRFSALSRNLGAITGTPTTSGTYTFTVTVSSSNATASKEFTLVIAEESSTPETPDSIQAPDTTGNITITKSSLASGKVGVSYYDTLTASFSAVTWSIISGDLPDGLALDSLTGSITGIPTKAGSYTFTAEASRFAGLSSIMFASDTVSASKEYTITIEEADTQNVAPEPDVSPEPEPDASPEPTPDDAYPVDNSLPDNSGGEAPTVDNNNTGDYGTPTTQNNTNDNAASGGGGGGGCNSGFGLLMLAAFVLKRSR
ncbi:MAG: putative Ig domain-containing protein [Synergistaceae bacterium]|nr:putative Ig domain-containing protein [Synergistaceae bacterium]